MITHEDALKVLRELKGLAGAVELDEDFDFTSLRLQVEPGMRRIVDTLLALNLREDTLRAWGTPEDPLVRVLRDLKDSAVNFDNNVDSTYADDMRMANFYQMDIVEKLMELDLDGKRLENEGDMKGKEEEMIADDKKQVDVIPAAGSYHAFDDAIVNCEWIVAQAKELRALLAYRSDVMIHGNRAGAMSAIETMRGALEDIEGFLIDRELAKGNVVEDVLEDATLRSGKHETGREEKGLEIG